MKVRDLSLLRIPFQRRKAGKPRYYKVVRGFDVETHKGKAFLIANSDGDTAWVQSFEDCVQFLMKWKHTRGLNVFYNMDYDVRSILAYLERWQLERLYKLGKLEYGDLLIEYIPKKLFRLKSERRRVTFYDIFQFFRMSLDKAARKFLGERKIEIDVEKFDDWEWIQEHKREIERYCIKDAWLCAKLAEYIQNLYKEAGVGFYRPISPAALAERHYLRTCRIPRHPPLSVCRDALKAYHGGRFEVLQRGYFEEVY